MFRSHRDREFQRTAAKQNSNQDEKNVFDCDLCDSGDWLSETEVELHRKSMHSRYINKLLASEPYACWNCIQTFKNNDDLIEHIKYTHLHSSKHAKRIERKIFICDYCQQIFFNKDLFEIHVTHHHVFSAEIVFRCPLCQRRKLAKFMAKHLTRHSLQSVSVCQICLLKQPSRKALEKHIQTHAKYLACDLCGHVSMKEKHFNYHIDTYERKHKRFDVKNYQKYFLHPRKKMIPWRSSFRRRLSGLVIFNELYICILCRQLCVNHTEMQTHIFRDHSSDSVAGDTEVKKVCSCGQQFTTMIMLKHHIFKTEGEHRLSYTEINRTTHDSDDDELTSNTNRNEMDDDPKPEIIVLDTDMSVKEEIVYPETDKSPERRIDLDPNMDLKEEIEDPKQEFEYSFENI